MRTIVIGYFGLWIVGSAGCDAAGGSEAATVVRDSAGISIVENSHSMWRSGQGWRLSATPEVVVGDRLDDPDYELFRVTGAVRLPDGRLVIANSGTQELRFYDATGVHLRTVGRQGGGPGEFEWVGWMARYGADSLIAWDSRLRRISVFDRSGDFQRNENLEDQTYFADFAFSDGTLIAREMVMMMMGGDGDEIIEGSQRRTVQYASFAPTGERLGDMGPFPEDEYWIDVEEHMHRWLRVFGGRTVRALADSIFWVGTGRTYTLNGYDRNGRLVRQVRNLTHKPAPVIAGDVTQWVEETMAGMESGMADHMRSFFESIPPPEMMPPYDDLVVDTEGNLWVERYQRPGESQHVWTVFDPEGQMLGAVDVPGGVSVLEIGNDYVLGQWQDEFDIEQVHLYRLIKS
jgi:hypothetical protein